MSLESEWHAMPEVRNRALRHFFASIPPSPYFWLGAEAEGLPQRRYVDLLQLDEGMRD